LVTGTCLSEFGHNVTCVDKNPAKIEGLLAGEMPIYEPGLDELVNKNVKAGRLHFATSLASAAQADAIFIAVGTPTKDESGQVDFKYVDAAIAELAGILRQYTVIVTKSTVPVGSAAKVRQQLKKLRADLEFDVVSNPEFLREGSAIEDFMKPDRIVVGTTSSRAESVMRDLYQPLLMNETPILFTDCESSELIKYAANAFLAAKITFINEVANFCEKAGANVQDVSKGIGMDSRIGPKFLQPGPGYGGSCFPKDTLAMAQMGRAAKTPLPLIESVIKSNDSRKKEMANKIIASLGGKVKGAKIAVLGLTFKANTDDMRDAPSLDILPILNEQGAEIHAYDPQGMKEALHLMPFLKTNDDMYAVMQGAEALVVLTEWNEFRVLDWPKVYALMQQPLVIDLRNIYELQDMEEQGFTYISVGRTPVLNQSNVKQLKKHA
jgi:UDPglucose 6-dehydrogenase